MRNSWEARVGDRQERTDNEWADCAPGLPQAGCSFLPVSHGCVSLCPRDTSFGTMRHGYEGAGVGTQVRSLPGTKI